MNAYEDDNCMRLQQSSILVWGYSTERQDDAYCHNHTGVNQSRELCHLHCCPSDQSNIIKDASLKCMKSDYVIQAFLLDLYLSQL